MLKGIQSWLESLRFPVLVIVATVLLIANLLIPDALPFVDEILLGVVAIILSRLKRRPKQDSEPQPPETTE